MVLLLDIGNTNTHLGLGHSRHVIRHADIPTSAWRNSSAKQLTKGFVGNVKLEGCVLCSVVPAATGLATRLVKKVWSLRSLELTPTTLKGIGIEYPKPNTIGPDRLANAIAVQRHFGQPSVAVDFGTALTIDVVNKSGNYVGGIIAPGLSAMTEYLHEKTALLPRIKIREVKSAIGKSTEEAILIAAIRGYRGLVRTLLQDIRREIGGKRVPIVATGGYARLMAAHLPEITSVQPLLTLEGIRLTWYAHNASNRTG
jgi:type III pantothenate kinase